MDNSGRTLKVSQVWQAIQGLARVFTHTSLEKLVKQDQEEEEERPGDRERSKRKSKFIRRIPELEWCPKMLSWSSSLTCGHHHI